jgi:hypothetical protein
VTPPEAGPETRFLNIDLELITCGALDLLLAHWSRDVVVLRDSIDGRTRTVWLEAVDDVDDAERSLLALLHLIDGLPADLRLLWDSCDDRCFNIGIQAGMSPHASAFSISTGTLTRVTGVMARLNLTVYAPEVPRDA